jgi:hypothetical protein
MRNVFLVQVFRWLYLYNKQNNKNKLCGLSPRVYYIDRATAACRRS